VINQLFRSNLDNVEIDAISPFVIGSFVLNALWLTFNARRLWGISLAFIAIYLLVLTKIYSMLKIGYKSNRTWREVFTLVVPVSLNISWAVAANFADLTLVLTAWGWSVPSDFASAEVFLIGVVACYVLFSRRDIPYAAVAIWGLSGIYRGQPNHSDVRKACIAMITLSLISLLGGFIFRRLNPNAFSFDDKSNPPAIDEKDPQDQHYNNFNL
jgi:hypothetical protein